MFEHENQAKPITSQDHFPTTQQPNIIQSSIAHTPQIPKPAKTNLGFGKKILLAVTLGLFFGIFGALGFQAVNMASGFIFGNIAQEVFTQNERTTEDAVETMGGAAGERTEELSPSLRTTGLIESTQITAAVVTDITNVVEEVMPSVVSVSNIYLETYSYFGRQFTDEGESSGSGIIVGENETEILIVTNYHVVQSASTLNIQFVDGSVAEALVKGSKPNMDLAVVAVNLADLSADTLNSIAIATLGDSDILKVGEPAIAIGNAMGYGQSVTTGIISAIDRETSYFTGGFGAGGYQIEGNFIQTDAAINPGNSGGALLNIKGEVIGINSSKIGGSIIEGMGYAIPISAAKPIIAELMIQETRVRVSSENQGFIGISGITAGDEISELYGLPKGVFVTRVHEGTPAEKHDIREGDIITHFDGVEIGSWDELLKRIAFYSADMEIEITLIRGDAFNGYEEMKINLILGRRTE
ncbi:MAG: trypsin-like peptidase domain-containing protein [Lachnospiraceae bacterium]|nr:trypsin-like peptidase domain-containing protein [Lachnospiraceae bacterium]